MKRMSFAVLGAAAAVSPVLLAGACGDSANPVDASDIRAIEVDMLAEVGEAADAGDAEPDWWAGCPGRLPRRRLLFHDQRGRPRADPTLERLDVAGGEGQFG